MASRSALFLDRDGVINIDHGYVYKPADFHFVDGIFSLCRTAQTLGMRIVVATNQAGIAYGYYSEDDFRVVCTFMEQAFRDQGVKISGIYHCPYHPDGIGRWRQAAPPCRKPAPGMLLAAANDLGLELSDCALIGDQETDILAARAAGLGTAMLFDPAAREPATSADIVVGSLAEAELWLTEFCVRARTRI